MGAAIVPHVWQGWTGEFFDWMKSSKGPKDGIFKTSCHAVDWYKHFNGGYITPEIAQFRVAMRDSKNAMAFAQFPEQISKVVKSSVNFFMDPGICTAYKTFLDGIGMISPINDAAEFLNARVVPIAAETLKPLATASAGALAISMTDSAVKDVVLIVEEAIASADLALPVARRDRAITRIGLALIDLAKCISYLALAAIALISTLYMPIAFASFWILVTSTSALGLTILGEFANRAFNPLFPESTARWLTVQP